MHAKSLIVHQGTALRKGHYTSICLNEEWLKFNDQKVTPISADNVAKQEAYMLFYLARPQ